MIQRFAYGDPELEKWLDRSTETSDEVRQSVARIVEDVRIRGLDAVLEVSRRFDAPGLEAVLIEPQEVDLPEEQASALRMAIERVRRFHEHQLDKLTEGWEPMERGWAWRMPARDQAADTGIEGQRLLPVRSAGIYAPGGKAAYPSSVIHNAVPAQVAGVERIVLATPAQPDGSLHPAIAFVCRELDIRQVLLAGGAAAIASLAFGGEGLERVDTIAGPGSDYVNEAKRLLWGRVGLDLYAGPSEVAVVADSTSDAEFAASDLLCQIEHAPDNVGLIACADSESAESIANAIDAQIACAGRAEILRKSLVRSAMVVCETTEQLAEIVNAFAPEHLSIQTDDPGALLPLIECAGSIALGDYSTQSVGDYVSGPSHTLPTGRSARFASPVNVATFLKFQSISRLEVEDLEELQHSVQEIAGLEGLPQHSLATTIRLQKEIGPGHKVEPDSVD